MTTDEYMTMCRLLNSILTEVNHAKLVLESKYGYRRIEPNPTAIPTDAPSKVIQEYNEACSRGEVEKDT